MFPWAFHVHGRFYQQPGFHCLQFHAPGMGRGSVCGCDDGSAFVREIAENLVKGLTNGTQPFLGFNYGAGEYERVKKAIKFMSAATISFTVVCWILISIFPEFFICIFNQEPDLVAAAVRRSGCTFSAFALCLCSLRVRPALSVLERPGRPPSFPFSGRLLLWFR